MLISLLRMHESSRVKILKAFNIDVNTRGQIHVMTHAFWNLNEGKVYHRCSRNIEYFSEDVRSTHKIKNYTMVVTQDILIFNNKLYQYMDKISEREQRILVTHRVTLISILQNELNQGNIDVLKVGALALRLIKGKKYAKPINGKLSDLKDHFRLGNYEHIYEICKSQF